MIKKISILIIIFHIASVFQSCCVEDYKFRWVDFNINVIDNSDEIPIITEEINLNKNALGFRIIMQDTVYWDDCCHNFSLINKCYATSCDRKDIPLHNLTEIQVITINDYSEDYPASSNITELFKARESQNTKSDYISIEKIISVINNHDNYTFANFDLYLMDTNCISGEHIFEIILNFSDGVVITKQTNLLNLN